MHHLICPVIVALALSLTACGTADSVANYVDTVDDASSGADAAVSDATDAGAGVDGVDLPDVDATDSAADTLADALIDVLDDTSTDSGDAPDTGDTTDTTDAVDSVDPLDADLSEDTVRIDVLDEPTDVREPDVDVAECDDSRWDSGCAEALVCVDGACVAPPAVREDYAFKAIQPDFHSIDDIAGNGAGRVSMNLVWAFWQPELLAAPCPAGWEEYGGTCFVVDAPVDSTIRAYAERGVGTTAIVYGSPPWARAARTGCPSWAGAASELFCAPDELARFALFAEYLAWRYRGPDSPGGAAIDDFVIWNEVNADDWFSLGGWPNAANAAVRVSTHAAMFWLAADAIRSRRPDARVYVSLTHLFGGSDGAHMSGYDVLRGVDALAAGRRWDVAAHPYSHDVGGLVFGANDAPRITFGTLHEHTGWLAALHPADPPDVYITEVGFDSRHGEAAQATALCEAYRQALATPGITGFVYHRYHDHAGEGGLLLGLAALDDRQKPAWSTWALMDRADAGPGLDCGFEHGGRVRVYRWRSAAGNYWVTPRNPVVDGYARESQSWLIEREPLAGSVALYDCRAGAHDHFVSDDARCEGQTPMGPIGYAHPAAVGDMVPMYRCYSASEGRHFVSQSASCEGWTTERLLGWAAR